MNNAVGPGAGACRHRSWYQFLLSVSNINAVSLDHRRPPRSDARQAAVDLTRHPSRCRRSFRDRLSIAAKVYVAAGEWINSHVANLQFRFGESDATGPFADPESQLRQSRAGTSQHALLPGRDSETRRQPGSSQQSGDLTPSGAVSAAVKQFTAKLDRRPAQLSRRSTEPVEDKSVVSHTPPDGPRPG